MSSSIFIIFSSKTPLNVTISKPKKFGIPLLLKWHKMAKNVFCVKVGDFNDFTDFTDFANFTDYQLLLEITISMALKLLTLPTFLALKSLNLATFPTLNDNHKRDPSRQTGLQHKHIFIIRNFNHSMREWAKWVNRVSVQREHREAERCGASERSQRAEWVVQMNKCSEWLRGPFKMRLSKTKKRALSSQITYESPLPDYFGLPDNSFSDYPLSNRPFVNPPPHMVF